MLNQTAINLFESINDAGKVPCEVRMIIKGLLEGCPNAQPTEHEAKYSQDVANLDELMSLINDPEILRITSIVKARKNTRR
jgi:hypothetical protein